MTAQRLLIRGGTVVDGSGGEPYAADVLLADGVIAAVGPDLASARSGQASETGISQLDATGLLVTPGSSMFTPTTTARRGARPGPRLRNWPCG